jgi:signal transduction histidine kinase
MMRTEDVRDWVRTQLWDQVPVRIAVINQEFRIVEANQSFRSTYGDWWEKPCFSVYKGRSRHCEGCAASRTFKDGKMRVREEQGLPLEGKPTFYLVHMVPLVRPEGTIPYVIEMSTDITATKLLERQKLEAERLAAVGQTVAGLAHGIKNVLMGLEGGLYVFQSGLKKGDNERMLAGWQMLEEDIGRITAFVKEFLEFARGKTPKVRLVDPNRIARDVVELFRQKAAMSGIALVADLQEDIPGALLDEQGIHTCLTNLVSNALDACEISDKPGRHVTVSSRDSDGVLVFEVADDGTGMDYEVKKNVFTGFFSTKGSDRGTGLGLLTTRKIVQQHGGTVSFESTEGVGSLFRMEFPRNRLPRPSPQREKAAAGRSVDHGQT